MTSLPPLQPVILSGGVGSRLWPLSRAQYPKQFLPLLGKRSLLQQTLLRLPAGFLAPIAVCNEEHRFIISEQLRQIHVAPAATILEPEARNTGPAIALAVHFALRTDPARLLLILPTDHHIEDVPAFHAAIERAAAAAQAGHIVTFGITPTRPDTGFGYIQSGAPLAGLPGAQAVARFVEKPDAERARALCSDGQHVWNGGMFLARADVLAREFQSLAPEIFAATDEALRGAHLDLDFLRPMATSFTTAPAISFDYAVMEKSAHAAVVPCALGWSDLGSWDALWEAEKRDAQGNVVLADARLLNSQNCYVRGEKRLIALSGVEDLVVVDTEDALLITRRGKTQDVKAVSDLLKKEGRAEVQTHKKVYRPWGHYQSLHDGVRFQVKEISVKPGGKLSLQKHFHRAEHWVVVNGSALVTRNNEEILLGENESVYLPLGCVHRLENPGKVTLNLIEVQSGSYLGEDDIVRLEDTYGRAEAGAKRR